MAYYVGVGFYQKKFFWKYFGWLSEYCYLLILNHLLINKIHKYHTL